jgi:Flp pilus assembly protein protease CpaA
MGGGDAKLLVALGALLGPLAFVVFLLFVSIAGGLFAIVAKIRGEKELPYAPAFALGWLGLVLLR